MPRFWACGRDLEVRQVVVRSGRVPLGQALLEFRVPLQGCVVRGRLLDSLPGRSAYQSATPATSRGVFRGRGQSHRKVAQGLQECAFRHDPRPYAIARRQYSDATPEMDAT
jgi:hypothetical protein